MNDPSSEVTQDAWHQQYQQHYPAADNYLQQQEEFYNTNPPVLLHHHQQQSGIGYPPTQQQQQLQPDYDIAYCKAQWMYYDDWAHCGQYEAYCFREAYTLSSNFQPSDPSNPPTLPPPTPPLTRHQHQLQIQQQQQQQRGAANKSFHSASAAILNSIGPKPSQSESRMPGRHPHPPSGNNAKLKHKCPFDGCPWRFATPYKLRRHIKSHTKETPFVCKECGRGFSVRYNLLMHIQTIHSQPQRFKCPMKGCKEAFHTQPRLNGHLRRVHKKDWKTMQPPKLEGEGKQGGGGGGGSRSSSTSSDDSVEAAPKTQRFECLQCSAVFSSQAKLSAHLKCHPSDKFKCTIQGCNKTFATKEKLTKHLEIHKQPKQFCCPHENCNRVFLRQSHLKNHLKIHTQNYFVCPVMDCNEKFVSEADYNVHLNTHMNYGHKCGVAGCGHAFLTRKRLELHCRVMHGLELNGHQPLLPVPLGHGPPPLIPHSQHSPPHPPVLPTLPLTHNVLLNVEEGIREVDLPGLSADDIETILSENSNWSSGEQFKNFFHSAVELSELEAKLFSGSGYESDSGYSTYDVSPITSSAPMQFGACRPAVSTSYRSISPALTPVNPSPYISLSSSNPFQFGQNSMPMPLHSSGPATTPLPHSASPDGDFTFFPPTTPTFHHPPPPPLSAVPHPGIAPTQEAYMMQGGPQNGFPMQATTQYQRDFQLPPYAIIPDLRHSQQQQQQPGACSIEFTDILAESHTTPAIQQGGQGGKMQRQQRILSLPLLPPQNPSEIKVEIEPNGTTSPTSTLAAPVVSSSALPFPATSVKLETMSEGSPCNNSTATACKMSAQPPTTMHSHQTTPLHTPVQGNTSTHLQSFLATCSKLPSLQELVSSGVHPSVVIVTVSNVLGALEDGTKSNQSSEQNHKLGVKEGPYNILALHSRIANLTPEQSEKLADPKLISTAKHLATQHLEDLAAARRNEGKKHAHDAATGASLLSKQKIQITGSNNIVVQNKTYVKASVTVKAISKTQHQQHQKSGGVSRVGAGSSHMKSSHKKKATQWPRSMSKANLMAFREHILNKLKRGQEERSGSQENSPTHPSACVSPSASFEVDISDIPTQVRCSSEPANFFSRQLHGDASPSQLQTSHSASNIRFKPTSLKHFDADNLHPDFNSDILLTSSVLGLPDNLLADMEIDSLANISSPSEHDLVQFLCDPSPPSSVTSPIDNMEDLSSIQDFLSGSSEGNVSPTNTQLTSTASSSVQNSPTFSASAPITTTATTVVPQQQFTAPTTTTTTNDGAGKGENTASSMADMASLFNESINSIANVKSVSDEASVALEDSLESVFQRPTDPLLACGSRLHW